MTEACSHPTGQETDTGWTTNLEAHPTMTYFLQLGHTPSRAYNLFKQPQQLGTKLECLFKRPWRTLHIQF